MQPPSKDRWLDWSASLLIGLIAAVVFLPALNNDFVDWDNIQNFLANLHYQGFEWPQLHWMWTTFHLGHYVPLTWMTLGLDYVLWGMDPLEYQTSLVLHAANAVPLLRDPGFLDAYVGMVTLLAQQGRGKEALDYFALAQRLNPRSAEAHNHLGLALKDQGRGAEPIAQYRAALESPPGFAVAEESPERALKADGKPER